MRRKQNLILAMAVLIVLGLMGFAWAGWSAPVPVSEVNTAYRDSLPFLSFDGLTLYFVRSETDTFYYTRIYQATRPVPYGPFTSVKNISELNYSGGHVSQPWVSQDNLRMYYYRTEPGSIRRMKLSERASVTDPWPAGINISELNALGNVCEPSLTADELTIVFGGLGLPGTLGLCDLWIANRPNRSSPFENVRNLSEINTASDEGCSFISSDGLTLLFHSNRNGLYQLFKATRTSLTEPFGNLEHLSFFDTPGGHSGGPYLSSDGTALYFVSWLRDENRDIYVSYLTEPRTLIGLGIVGPNEVAENFSAGYRAIAFYDDNSTRDVTDSVLWAVGPNTIAGIEAGVLTTKDVVNDQPATLQATYTEGDVTFEAKKVVDIFTICPTGTALSFDGVDDYVAVNSVTSDISNKDFTLMAWINSNSTSSSSNNQVFLGFNDNLGGNRLLLGYPNPSSVLQVYDPSLTTTSWINTNIQIIDGTWHHIVYVLNVIEDSATIYVDGKNVHTYPSNTSIYSNDLFSIGQEYDDGPVRSDFWNGTIDDVRIYDRTLSVEEIRANMHNRLAGDEVGLVGYWDFDEGEGQIVYDLTGNGNDGQLGSTPYVDAGDPAWIESDAPIGRCTPYLIAVAAAEKALKHKSASLKELEAALAQEWTMYEALEQWLESGDFVDLSKGDIVTSKQKAHSAMQHEEQSIDMLGKGFEKLLDSLISLGYEPESLMPY